MNELLINKRKELEKEQRICYQRAFDYTERAKEITLLLANLEKEIEIRVLQVTDHAYQRFKERVLDIPEKRIKPILTSKTLLDDYKKYGDGEYRVKELPHVTLVIRDFAIITVINTADYIERLTVLREYMDYFIDTKVEMALGCEIPPMRLKTYRKHYYKAKYKNAA